MKSIALSDGRSMPRLGMGTWKMGEHPNKLKDELEALNYGLDHGMTLIDTAEMYGNGLSEDLIEKAIRGRDRSKLFIVDKVLPWHAGKGDFMLSLDGSLHRLHTDYLDLYLLHWRGEIPLEETVGLMEEAKALGKIKGWGVSNFDVSDMEDLLAVPNGKNCLVDQCLWHLGSRGVEYDLLPWLKAHRMAFMAYCPLAMGGRLRESLLTDPAVQAVADAHGVDPIEILLAFVLHDPHAIAIPKAGQVAHMRANIEAGDLTLTDAEMDRLNQAFPAPRHKVPLEMQ